MDEDKRDHVRIISKEELKKARVQAEQLLRENPNFNNSTSSNEEVMERDSQSEQSEEDYQLYGPRCLDSRPRPEKKDTRLKSARLYGNCISIGTSFTTGSAVSIVNYSQNKECTESLLLGLCASLVSGIVIKTANYIINERPLIKLEALRTRLSELEK